MKLAQHVESKAEGWWAWSVWLEGDPAALDGVEAVTYFLHPTFPSPVQTRTNREDGFLIQGNGWGEFIVRARVAFKDGREEILKLPLHFDGAQPHPPRLPTFFISHSLADTGTAEAVRQALENDLHLEFVEPTSAEPGLPLSVENLIQDSDALIAIVSDKESLWVQREIDMAEKLHVPVVSIVVGSAELPANLSSRQVIRLDEVGQGPRFAKSLEEALSLSHVLAERDLV
ncbi:MAG TPA: pYEATS domain-containing protein [Thermoanaerobaculia bacterium]|nr:pYEATS domain-containing protein [Thermoanaerobaculia bacterium]